VPELRFGFHYIKIDGEVIGSAQYGGSSVTVSGIVSSLTSSINAQTNGPVKASSSGSKITLTSKFNGAATNYSLSTTYTTNYPTYMQAIPSGQYLTGGTD